MVRTGGISVRDQMHGSDAPGSCGGGAIRACRRQEGRERSGDAWQCAPLRNVLRGCPLRVREEEHTAMAGNKG